MLTVLALDSLALARGDTMVTFKLGSDQDEGTSRGSMLDSRIGDEYESIISILRNTGGMLERSPKTFAGMKEESLRDLFLVTLNSHYGGQVTSETFNKSGKTDILVRDGDRSVLIAECKIWRGQASLCGAIDQLLQYVTWRDTNTAILLFNRNKEISQVVAQIPVVVSKHPNFKREIPISGDGTYRCVLGHRDDSNRELIVTILVFEVPD